MKATLLILVAIGAANACRFPPSLWCDSREIALQCKVYDQCKESVWREDLQASPVDFELYYESLCPDCRQFITQQLYQTFTQVGHIMNLTLVPFGNAQESKQGDRWVFQCQHGKQECVGNLLETCAIHALGGNMDQIMPFIYCVESSQRSPMAAVKTCAGKQGLPLEQILSCYNSSEGNQLEHQMALRTNALNPPHQYVPWVVLNGVHTEKINTEATQNLLKLICDTYTGPKPKACAQTEGKKASMRTSFF
ncbi:gamma-interferon-inducible lysosomal thiol reductase-like [Babylonia areolata]|uniref:gamma-interferon-inducible lysosomal thiol reductase-like n=1 Tax=Babylonia areolata TaxID=304850 RepID=UPI003FCF3FE5